MDGSSSGSVSIKGARGEGLGVRLDARTVEALDWRLCTAEDEEPCGISRFVPLSCGVAKVGLRSMEFRGGPIENPA